MGIVHYPDFREHQRQRVQTNDTMMGLLAGSKLASQTLHLTKGSKILMSEIFPRVDHIQRFNLTTDKAREVLDDAEQLLGILAVPQVMALQEDLMLGMLKLMQTHVTNFGILTNEEKKAYMLHKTFERKAGDQFTPESLQLFHLIRLARNTHIHNGGKAGSALVSEIRRTSPQTFQAWTAITKSKFPSYNLKDSVALGLSELIGALAVTKRLADEANAMLQRVLPRDAWADIAVADWLADRKPGDKNQENRQLHGVVRLLYKPLNLLEPELDAAKARAGVY